MTANKRDLFVDGFTESDFEFGTHSGQKLVAKIMMDKANAILREALENATTVFSPTKDDHMWARHQDEWSSTHTGKLVAVKALSEPKEEDT